MYLRFTDKLTLELLLVLRVGSSPPEIFIHSFSIRQGKKSFYLKKTGEELRVGAKIYFKNEWDVLYAV